MLQIRLSYLVLNTYCLSTLTWCQPFILSLTFWRNILSIVQAVLCWCLSRQCAAITYCHLTPPLLTLTFVLHIPFQNIYMPIRSNIDHKSRTGETSRKGSCPPAQPVSHIQLYALHNVIRRSPYSHYHWKHFDIIRRKAAYFTHCIYIYTRSLGALRAPTSSLRPFGPLWLRPSRPSGAQAVWPKI